MQSQTRIRYTNQAAFLPPYPYSSPSSYNLLTRVYPKVSGLSR